MYHPGLADTAGEFVEVMNVSPTDGLDLTGVSFSDGITFAFPLGFTLAPGERVAVVADAPAFAAVHPGVRIAGTFSGALNNGGERLALSDSRAVEFLAFTYDNNPPWPTSSDGAGPSLVLIAPETTPDHNLAVNWRASTSIGGNPGASDRQPFLGGDLLAYAFASHPVFDFATMSYSVFLQPGTDDVELIPQWSTDLQNWFEASFIYLGRSPSTWQAVLPPQQLERFFVRFKIETR